MNSSFVETRNALLWLVIPGTILDKQNKIELWLTCHVKSWARAIREGAAANLRIKVVIISQSQKQINDNARRMIAESVKSVIKISGTEIGDIAFETTNCLRELSPLIRSSEDICDLNSPKRCDSLAYRLLLVDHNGHGFPCYGFWQANIAGLGDFTQPDQKILFEAYSKGHFRSICLECAHAHHNKINHVFPCSRLGAHAIAWNWGSKNNYCHLQFAGKKIWCKAHEPQFEPSLEFSRSLLERIITSGNPPFWKTAFVGKEKSKTLSDYWGKEKDILPIFGDFEYGLETKTILDQFPLSANFPVTEDQITDLHDKFIPACFIPPLRSLFWFHDEVELVSIILADRHGGSQFKYRALFRESSPCFAESINDFRNNWSDVWHLPNMELDVVAEELKETHTNSSCHTRLDSHQINELSENPKFIWRDTTLNLSSSVLNPKSKQPVEYIALLKSDHNLIKLSEGSKIVLNFSSIIYHINRKYHIDSVNCFFSFHADLLRYSLMKSPLEMYKNYVFPGQSSRLDEIFLDIWQFCFEKLFTDSQYSEKAYDGFSKLFYRSNSMNSIKPCYEAADYNERVRIGYNIANYIIWVFAVFGKDTISSIECFNSTTFADKQPTQLVVFSKEPLSVLARSRFKLTLSTLLQPIESSYAIAMEMQKSDHKMRELLIRITRHGFGNWTESANGFINRADRILKRDGYSNEEALSCLSMGAQDCGVGRLHTIGLHNYGIKEQIITVKNLVDIIKDRSGLGSMIDIDTDRNNFQLLVKGRIVLVLAEIIANSIKSLRNKGFNNERLAMNLTLKDHITLTIELKNKCFSPEEWLRDEKWKNIDDFPNNRGLFFCSSILDEIGGTLHLRYFDKKVTSKVIIPISGGENDV